MDELNELGAQLVVISPQTAEHSRAMIEQKKLQFDILRDPGNEVAHAYKLRWTVPDDLKQLYLQWGVDLAASNGDDSWTLPLPARFILDQVGVIRYARVSADYTRRPEPQETLAQLRRVIASCPSR